MITSVGNRELGHKRAIVAVAHALADTVFEVLSTGQPYTETGSESDAGDQSGQA